MSASHVLAASWFCLLMATGCRKGTTNADEFGPGDIGGVAKLKDTRAGDWLAAREQPLRMPVARPREVRKQDRKSRCFSRRIRKDPQFDLMTRARPLLMVSADYMYLGRLKNLSQRFIQEIFK